MVTVLIADTEPVAKANPVCYDTVSSRMHEMGADKIIRPPAAAGYRQEHKLSCAARGN